MSFEQRHRRQQSSADSSISKDDGAPKAEDFDKTILHIQRKLDQIPRQYKEPSEVFNPLEQVIEMMKSSNLKERKRELDNNVKTLDKAMESIVRGTLLPYILFSAFVSPSKALLRLQNCGCFSSSFKTQTDALFFAAHYDGFNKAIKNYTQILGLVTQTGNNNSTLSQNAAKCHTLFTSRSHSVNSMYLQSLEYGYMIEILDKMFVSLPSQTALEALERPLKTSSTLGTKIPSFPPLLFVF